MVKNVYIIRGHHTAFITPIANALADYYTGDVDDDGSWDDFDDEGYDDEFDEDSEESIVLQAVDTSPIIHVTNEWDCRNSKLTWEQVASQLLIKVQHPRIPAVIVCAHNIGSLEFVRYCEKLLKSYKARVIDVTVKNDSDSSEVKKFNQKELYV